MSFGEIINARRQYNINAAREIYNIRHWGGGYFDIDERGHVLVSPERDPERAGIDLYELAGELRAAGLSLPVLVRFTDILSDRVRSLCAAFRAAIAEHDYAGGYTAVYPIKVNQQRRVVEAIVEAGQPCVGLEAGSKPELMAVLAMVPSGGVVVCNGYKDREYIRLALIGRALGHRVYIVVEKLSELELVIREAADLGVEPLLGMRVRLASLGAGKWQNTGGEKSKFGLSAAQVLRAVERLREAGLLGSLRLLHVHLGSQIANIRDIQRGMSEVARYFAELCALGVPLAVVDVGGGLGVDYEGSRSRSHCSINYSMDEYASNVVHALWDVCREYGLTPPEIFSESGRAMTAHHAVLIANVIDVDRVPGGEQGSCPPPAEGAPQVLHDLYRLYAGDPRRSLLETYHDAAHWLGEAQGMYLHGLLSIAERAQAEELYYAVCRRLQPQLDVGHRSQRELLDELNEKLADKYFCNFSLFQSLPDVWAIDQLFPIMPLHRLDEEPSVRAVLQDVTCDSDGRVDAYVDGEGVETTLPLHELRPGEPYLLGFFMIGAYQEILGDLHNLFGDTNAVNVIRDDDGGFHLEEPDHGDSVDELLRYVHFEPDALRAVYRDKVAASGFDAAIQAAYLEELEAGIIGYTYLED